MLLAQWDQISGTGFVAALASITLFISLATNCFLLWERLRKHLPEIRKLNAEIDKLGCDTALAAATTLNLLQSKKMEYDKLAETFQDASLEMVKIIENGSWIPSDLDHWREKSCRSLCQALSGHIRYIQFEGLYYQSMPKSLSNYIHDELCEDIERFAYRLYVINSPKLLDGIGRVRSPLAFARTTLKPYFRLSDSLPEELRQPAHAAIADAVEKLNDAGKDRH